MLAVPYDKEKWFMVKPCTDPMLNFVDRKRQTRVMCKVCHANLSAGSTKTHHERMYHLRAAAHRQAMGPSLSRICDRGADGAR